MKRWQEYALILVGITFTIFLLPTSLKYYLTIEFGTIISLLIVCVMVYAYRVDKKLLGRVVGFISSMLIVYLLVKAYIYGGVIVTEPNPIVLSTEIVLFGLGGWILVRELVE